VQHFAALQELLPAYQASVDDWIGDNASRLDDD
jgi:hypothetical protein